MNNAVKIGNQWVKPIIASVQGMITVGLSYMIYNPHALDDFKLSPGARAFLAFVVGAYGMALNSRHDADTVGKPTIGRRAGDEKLVDTEATP